MRGGGSRVRLTGRRRIAELNGGGGHSALLCSALFCDGREPRLFGVKPDRPVDEFQY